MTNKNEYATGSRSMQRLVRPQDPPEGCKLVAVHDGRGESATWLLTVEDTEGELAAILAWPKDWPSRVNSGFLKKHGYECIVA